MQEETAAIIIVLTDQRRVKELAQNIQKVKSLIQCEISKYLVYPLYYIEIIRRHPFIHYQFIYNHSLSFFIFPYTCPNTIGTYTHVVFTLVLFNFIQWYNQYFSPFLWNTTLTTCFLRHFVEPCQP